MKSRTLPGIVALVALPMLAACGHGGLNQVDTAAGHGVDNGSLASSLDAPLAVGAEVRPSFKTSLRGSTAPPIHLLATRADILDVHDGLLVGRSPGVAAVLFATDDETVVDFLHVSVRPADHLEVHGIDASGGDLGPLTVPIELVAGDGLRLVPHAYAGSEQLVGVATSTWTVDPPIAIVLREGLPNRVRLVARTPGHTTVKVAMLDVTATIDLTVVP